MFSTTAIIVLQDYISIISLLSYRVIEQWTNITYMFKVKYKQTQRFITYEEINIMLRRVVVVLMIICVLVVSVHALLEDTY